MNYSDETADEFARVQEQIDAVDGWNLDTTLEIAMDALRTPPGDADVATLSGGERRRVALVPPAAPPARPAAARRADQPPRRRVGRLARAPPPGLRRARSSRSPTTATSSTTSPAGSSSSTAAAASPTRATTPAGSSRSAPGSQQEEKQETARQRTIDQELEWVRLNASARRNKPKARLNAYEALLAEDRNVKLDQVQIHIPAGPRLGDIVVEANGLRKAYGDRVLIDDLSFNLPRGGIVGVIGPNGAGKTTLLRMITGQEQPDAGTLRIGETVELAYVDQSRDALDPDKTVWEEISGGAGSDQARRPHGQQPRLRGRLQLQGLRPAEEGREALRRRAQPAPPGEAAAHRRQPAAARRADQRPRRRHAARARGGAARVRRLRGGRLPRSLVPRPDRHPRPRVRGRLAGPLVRGQLRGLRDLPPRAARRRRRPAASGITYKKLVRG